MAALPGYGILNPTDCYRNGRACLAPASKPDAPRRCRLRYDCPGRPHRGGPVGREDSLALLDGLAALRRYYPAPFSLCAVTLDLGFGKEADFSAVEAFCAARGVPLCCGVRRLPRLSLTSGGKKTPARCAPRCGGGRCTGWRCSRAATSWRWAIILTTPWRPCFSICFYEGRLGCFSPVTWLSRAQLTTIRPMIYVEERDIRALVKREGYPVYRNPCCADGNTKRQEIKELLERLERGKPRPAAARHGGAPACRAGRLAPAAAWQEGVALSGLFLPQETRDLVWEDGYRKERCKRDDKAGGAAPGHAPVGRRLWLFGAGF